MSAASFLNSSFFQAINAMKLRPVHVQKIPQASEHLCPAKLQTDVISAVLASLSARSFPLTPACKGGDGFNNIITTTDRMHSTFFLEKRPPRWPGG